MLAALPQPLEVEQVGGGLLDSPALIAVAAIIAAGLAAWVARRNHGQQLKHDRELRDLDYARKSISSAVETVAQTVGAVGSLATSAWAASEAREYWDRARELSDKHLTTYGRDEGGSLFDRRTEDERQATDPGLIRAETELIQEEAEASRELNAALRKAREAHTKALSMLSELLADNLRLRITIGKSTEVVSLQGELSDAFKEWVDELRPDPDGHYRMEGDPEEEVDPVGERMLELVDACQRWSATTSHAAD